METDKARKNEPQNVEIKPTPQDIYNSILLGFQRKLKPRQIYQECQRTFGANGPSLMTVVKHFRRFQAGNFNMDDESRKTRTKTALNDSATKTTKTDGNQAQSTQAGNFTMDEREIRITIKFLLMNGLSPSDIINDIQKTLGDSAPPYETLHNWIGEARLCL